MMDSPSKRLLTTVVLLLGIVGVFLVPALTSARLACVADDPLCEPPSSILLLRLSLQSIAPFTTIAQAAPETLVVPRDTTITFSVSSNLSVYDFVWAGAEELSQTSTSSSARSSFLSPTTSTVTVTPVIRLSDGTIQTLPENARSISIIVTTDRASAIQMTITDPLSSPVVGYAGQRFSTRATTTPTGYEHLIQWTGGGSPSAGLGPTFATTYASKGTYTLKAGPTSSRNFTIYEITAITRDSPFGETVWYGFPITFIATTDPPGYEPIIPWRVETMGDRHTHAEPSTGLGSTFTTTFTNPPNDQRFWAQVYAGAKGAFTSTDPPPPVPAPITTAVYTPEPGTGTNPPVDGPSDGTGQPLPQGYATGMGADQDGYVYLNSGELYLTAVDLEIPGRGFPYRFVRSYKSRIQYAGVLGHDWDHHYNMRLMKHRDASNQLTGHMLLASGLARQDLYVRNPNGTFRSPIGFYTNLTQYPDGSFTLRDRHGIKRHFVALRPDMDRLFLTSITDRNGNTMRFQYDWRGLLRTVIDTLGRAITYAYDANDRLNAIKDFANRVVTFTYDGNGDLVAVTSPAVVGTPNGNDFPQGKTTKYTYSSGFADPQLNHNLLTVTRPNEEALDPKGPPVLVNTYGTANSVPYELDKVLTQMYGGTNATMVPAGGALTYFYEQLNPGADPNNLTIARNRTTVIDRNGNVAEYEQNVLGGHVRYKEFTGRVNPALPRATLQTLIPSRNPSFPPLPRLRAADPAFFETTYAYNPDGELIRPVYQEGNRVDQLYDRTNPDRFQQGNLLEVRRVAGPRGGDGSGSPITDIVTKYVYEPLFNQVRMVSDPRGLDPAFVPPIDPSDTHVVGIDFDGDGAITAQEIRRARYTAVNVFDYQEGTAAQILDLAASEGVPLTATQAQRLSLGDTLPTDVNSDGLTNQQHGNIIQSKSPTVQLATGGTQEIVSLMRYNSRGQLLARVDPDESVDEYKYYPESNPHGAGGVAPDADTPSELGGYLGRVIQDTTATDNTDGVSLGIQTNYRYDPVGNLISVLDGRGIRTDFVVNQLNQIIRSIRAADVPAKPEPGLIAFGYTMTNFYNANDNLIQVDVQNKDGNTDVNTLLTTTYAYDILDRPVATTQEVDPTTILTTGYRYDANENRIRVIEPAGNFHDTVYDERDLVFTTTEGANDPAVASTITTTYDGNKNVKSVRDAEDTDGVGGAEETFFTYDGFDRLIKTLDPIGNESLSSYDPASNLITQKARGRIGGPSPTTNSTASNVDLARSAFQYDELNRRIRTDDEWFLSPGVLPSRPPLLGDGFRTTITGYDANSRVARVVNDNAHNVIMQYDGVDRVVRTVDALQNETQVAYDNNHNLIRLTSTERRGENPTATSPELFVTVNRYDALNRLRLTSDNLRQTQRIAYDSRNNVTAISDAQGPVDLDDPELGLTNRSGNTTRYFYDGLNRLTKVIRDLRRNGTGSGLPSLEGPTDPNVDPADLDTSNWFNPDGKITETDVWDANSRLQAATDDRGNTASYRYDALNRKTREIFADGTVNQYLYDRDNNLRQVTDENGSVFTHTYDALNRRTTSSILRAGIERTATTFETIIGGTTLQQFQYDGLNRITRATDNNDPTTWSDDSVVTALYDSLSRKIEEKQNGYAVTSDFDGFGNRLRLIYPSNRILTYVYDALERLKMIPGVVTYSFIGPGRVLEKTFASGAKLTYLDNAGADVGYDGMQRIVRHRHETPSDGTIVDFTYGYNRENMRRFERRLHQPVGPEAKGQASTYDSRYRLMTFIVGTQTSDGTIISPDTQTSYTLDGTGNRARMTKDSIVTAYSPNNMNEYDLVGGVPNIHDDNGNLRDDGTLLYVHDALNRLIEVKRKCGGLSIAKSTYDAFNRRVTKTVTNSGALNGFTRFFLDGPQEIEERNGASLVTAEYLYSRALDEPLAMVRGGQTFSYHDDSLGSIAALTNSAQTVIERTTYDAYGAPQVMDAAFNPIGTRSSIGNPFLFTAQRFDPETGLYYYRNRYYNPATGRFIERDPGGMWSDEVNTGNAYTYVGGNPINVTDPFGLQESREKEWESPAELFVRKLMKEPIKESKEEELFKQPLQFGRLIPGEYLDPFSQKLKEWKQEWEVRRLLNEPSRFEPDPEELLKDPSLWKAYWSGDPSTQKKAQETVEKALEKISKKLTEVEPEWTHFRLQLPDYDDPAWQFKDPKWKWKGKRQRRLETLTRKFEGSVIKSVIENLGRVVRTLGAIQQIKDIITAPVTCPYCGSIGQGEWSGCLGHIEIEWVEDFGGMGPSLILKHCNRCREECQRRQYMY